MKKLRYSASFLLVFLMFGCTDLEETTYSELSKTNFYNNKLEIIQATLRPFTHMQAWMAWSGQNGYYYHNELSADQVAWPQKGRHGYDNGDHFRQHYHTWTPEEGRMQNAWSLMWTGVGYVNAAIEDIEQVDPASANITEEELQSLVAESKVLRAYHYMKIMDLWGNVPIVTQVGVPENPATQPRTEVFKFIETELLENVEKLQPLSPQVLGRVSKAAGSVGTVSQMTDEDKTIIGNGLPKYYASLTNTFRYNNFDLTVFFRGKFDYDILNTVDLFYGNQSLLPGNILSSALDEYSQIQVAPQYSDYYLEKGDFVKLDNLTLGYTFPLENSRVLKRLRWYVSARNLATFTAYTGRDPEVQDTGLYPGLDTRNFYPRTTTVSTGINVQF